MRKLLTVIIAVAAIGAAAVATSSTADARWGGGWGGGGYGWRGGWGWGPGPFVAGALAAGVVGAAVASPYYYGGYGAYPYNPYYGYYVCLAYGTAITGSPPASEAVFIDHGNRSSSP